MAVGGLVVKALLRRQDQGWEYQMYGLCRTFDRRQAYGQAEIEVRPLFAG